MAYITLKLSVHYFAILAIKMIWLKAMFQKAPF